MNKRKPTSHYRFPQLDRCQEAVGTSWKTQAGLSLAICLVLSQLLGICTTMGCLDRQCRRDPEPSHFELRPCLPSQALLAPGRCSFGGALFLPALDVNTGDGQLLRLRE